MQHVPDMWTNGYNAGRRMVVARWNCGRIAVELKSNRTCNHRLTICWHGIQHILPLRRGLISLLGAGNESVWFVLFITTIRLRFDGRSTAYQRSLKLQWRNTGRWPASRSQADLFIYSGLSATAHIQLGRS